MCSSPHVADEPDAERKADDLATTPLGGGSSAAAFAFPHSTPGIYSRGVPVSPPSPFSPPLAPRCSAASTEVNRLANSHHPNPSFHEPLALTLHSIVFHFPYCLA